MDGGLDLDGLVAIRARQPKTQERLSKCIRVTFRQIPRAGGLEVTRHESDFATRREPMKLWISKAGGSFKRAGAVRPELKRAELKRQVPVKFCRFFGSSSRR